ncbi:MAG: hypothetical protein GY724_08095 [Actinomycetia bacterium]|nr:hypothetical protein [Actinomycetes bacterium]MCP4225154.1 hypothetical protein [Actinomycetes bacterium]MCP5033782.1 hypothetical protein [Actinomycetes bacterium]
MSDEIVEIRDYTIEPEWFDAYREWARDLAVPWLKANLNVIDFWVDDGHEALVSGSAPVAPANGQPNACWIIHWPSRDARDEGFAAFAANPEWQKIWAKHPNAKAYLQVNVRFMKPLV